MFEIVKRWQRHLSLILLILLMYFVYCFFVSPLQALSQEIYSRYVELAEQKNRYQRIASGSEVLQTQHQQLLDMMQMDLRYIKASSRDDAQLAFQEIILGLAQKAGTHLTSINFLSDISENSNMLAIEFQASLEHSQLQALLKDIESTELLVAVKEMRIETNPLSKNQHPQSSAIKVDVLLNLSTFWFES